MFALERFGTTRYADGRATSGAAFATGFGLGEPLGVSLARVYLPGENLGFAEPLGIGLHPHWSVAPIFPWSKTPMMGDWHRQN
jgi:hypothetical protein